MNATPTLLQLAILLVCCATAHAEITVRAGVAADEGIYPGEPFQYQIIIDGYDKPGAADVSPLADFSPRDAGGQNVSQVSISIVNGRRTDNSVKRYIMAYQLTAGRPGRFRLPPVNVQVNGRAFATNAVDIEVLKPATSTSLDLEIALSASRCYVGQPITLSARWYVSTGIADRIADYNFNIPILRDENSFIFESAPSRGADDSALRVELPSGPAVARQTRARHNDDDCILVQFDVILIPRRPGRVNLPAAGVTAKIDVSRQRRSRNPFDLGRRREYQRFLANAEAITLDVAPLPTADRPDDFNGLVGRYHISAAATPTEVNVGDPITLTVTIAGDLLKMVTAPDLASVGAFAENFKIPSEQASPKMTLAGKIYTQTIRAKNEQIAAIPPIPLSYFDVDKDAYVTVHSDPIPLQVSPTRIVTADQAVGGASAPRSSRLKQIKTGLAANYERPDLIENVAFSPVAALSQPSYLTTVVAPPLLLILAAFVRLSRRTNPVRVAARRRGAAFRKAAATLKRGTDSTHIADVLRRYIADRYDRSAPSLTPEDCAALLHADGKSAELIDQFRRLLETCNHSRYSRSGDDASGVARREIVSLLRRLQ